MKRPMVNFNDYTLDSGLAEQFIEERVLCNPDQWEFIHELETVDSCGNEYYTWFGMVYTGQKYHGLFDYQVVYLMPNDYKMRDSMDYVDNRKNILIYNFVKMLYNRKLDCCQMIADYLIKEYIKKPHSIGGNILD